MSPTESQRETDTARRRAILSIPPAPGIEFTYAGPDWTSTIDCPKQVPRTAKRVATLEWAWSPYHHRQDVYRLSTNRSRSHWILWYLYFDDDFTGKWEHFPYAFCAKQGIPAKTAAFYLLLEGWRGERARYGSPDEPFHYITSEGLLSAHELNLVAEVFWGTKSDAPSPVGIIRNIQENSARLTKAIEDAEVKGLAGKDDKENLSRRR